MRSLYLLINGLCMYNFLIKIFLKKQLKNFIKFEKNLIMKIFYAIFLSIFALVGAIKLNSQDTLFFDNFENGIANWQASGSSNWGVSSNYYNSPNKSLTESPIGSYGNNWNTSCELKYGIDLSNYLNATLRFWATYQIEQGFDFMYLEISKDNFQTYAVLDVFSGNDDASPLPPMQEYFYDISGFCGYSDVKIRFRFVSDGALVKDGMYIDDVLITGSTEDISGPLIIHTPSNFYEGSLYENVIYADVLDISGINSTYITYKIDNNPSNDTIYGTLVEGITYKYIIPAVSAGSMVEYFIHAIDNFGNESQTEGYKYIAGNHIIQDNGQVDYYTQLGPTTTGGYTGAAVKITLGNTQLVGVLIRNYTDINTPNDSMLVHVWSEQDGLPGEDLITPIKVFPAANLQEPSAMTWVDLRPYADQLSNLTGTYFIGFTVPVGKVNTTITQPGHFGKSYIYHPNQGWQHYSGSYGVTDFHFRAITTENLDLEGPAIINNSMPVLCEANLEPQQISCTILDPSGVLSSVLYYSVDNNSPSTINGTYIGNSNWVFTIPAQPAGAFVRYWISAIDSFQNMSQTDTFLYISGVYHKFDSGNINVYIPIYPEGTSQQITAIAQALDLLNYETQITTILIRNYVDPSNPSSTPNGPMKVCIWEADEQGYPNQLIINPIIVESEASVSNPLALTKVDIRNENVIINNKLIFVGFTVVDQSCAVLADSNNVFNKTVVKYNNVWYPANSDAQIRIITSQLLTNVNDMQDNFIDIFPNPTSNFVNVYVNDIYNNSRLYLFSIDGKKLIERKVESNNTLLDLSHLPQGVYICKIIDKNKSYNYKLIKK